MGLTVTPPTFGERLLGTIGLAVHVLVGFFVYLPFGLIAPTWAHLVMIGAWVALLAVGIVMMRRRPATVAAVPVIALALALLVATVGENLGGWTA